MSAVGRSRRGTARDPRWLVQGGGSGLGGGARGGGTGRGRAGARDTGRKGFRRARPSRSRPWLAVTVPETAGDVGGVAGSPRVCHGLVTGEGRVRHGRRTESDGDVPGPSPKCDPGAGYALSRAVRNLREPAVLLVRPRDVFDHRRASVVRDGRHTTLSNHADPCVVRNPPLRWISNHGRACVVGNPRMARVSNHGDP
jgi:hypothetical protein